MTGFSSLIGVDFVGSGVDAPFVSADEADGSRFAASAAFKRRSASSADSLDRACICAYVAPTLARFSKSLLTARTTMSLWSFGRYI